MEVYKAFCVAEHRYRGIFVQGETLKPLFAFHGPLSHCRWHHVCAKAHVGSKRENKALR